MQEALSYEKVSSGWRRRCRAEESSRKSERETKTGRKGSEDRLKDINIKVDR